MTRYDSIQHLLKQALDAMDKDGGLAAGPDDAETITAYRERVHNILKQLDSKTGGVDSQQLAADVFALLRDSTGPLAPLKPLLEDVVSVTKTVTD